MNPQVVWEQGLPSWLTLAAQVAMVVVVTALVLWRVRSATWRRVLWQGMFVCVAALVFLSSLDVARWLDKRRVGEPVLQAVGPVPSPGNDSESWPSEPQLLSPAALAESSLHLPTEINLAGSETGAPTSLGSSRRQEAPTSDFASDQSLLTSAATTGGRMGIEHSIPETPWWFWLGWAGGAVALLARLLISRLALTGFCWRHLPDLDPALCQRVQSLAGRLGLTCRVRVRIFGGATDSQRTADVPVRSRPQQPLPPAGSPSHDPSCDFSHPVEMMLDARAADEDVRGPAANVRQLTSIVRSPAHRPRTPIAFGLFLPSIAVPDDFMRRFTRPEQDAMLAHELAHLAARDPAWYLLADILCALLWWHPLVWWARAQLHAASEQCADEASLLVEGGPQSLAACLVRIAGELTRPASLESIGVEGDGFRSRLGRRVERLLRMSERYEAAPHRWQTGLARTLGPVVLLAAVLASTGWMLPYPSHGATDWRTRLHESWDGLYAALPVDVEQAVDPARSPDFLVRNVNAGQDSPANQSRDAKRQPAPQADTGALAPNASVQMKTITEGQRAVLEKLRAIRFGEHRFESVSLNELVRVLSDESKKLDPGHKGVRFDVEPASNDNSPIARADLGSVNVALRIAAGTPLSRVLLNVCKHPNPPLKFVIRDDSVVFVAGAPAEPMGDFKDLPQQSFRVDPAVVLNRLSAREGITLSADTDDARDALIRNLMDADVRYHNLFIARNFSLIALIATAADLKRAEAAIGALTASSEARPGKEGGAGLRTTDSDAGAQSFPILTEAVRLKQAGRTDEALVILNQILADRPGDSQAGILVDQIEGRRRVLAQRGLTEETAAEAKVRTQNRRQALTEKLNQIRFEQLGPFDGLPLGEIVRFLHEECRKLDPEKKGLNFILNPHLEQPDRNPGLPAQPLLGPDGLPIAPPPAPRIDVENAIITLRLPLRDLTLAQALDVIVKSADQPIQFIVEDYAIVFTARPGPQLFTRTFKVDPGVFLQGLQGVVQRSGVPGVAVTPAQVTQANAGQVFQQLLAAPAAGPGSAARSTARVHYDPEAGLLVAVGTTDDLSAVQQRLQHDDLAARPAAPGTTPQVMIEAKVNLATRTFRVDPLPFWRQVRDELQIPFPLPDASGRVPASVNILSVIKTLTDGRVRGSGIPSLSETHPPEIMYEAQNGVGTFTIKATQPDMERIAATIERLAAGTPKATNVNLPAAKPSQIRIEAKVAMIPESTAKETGLKWFTQSLFTNVTATERTFRPTATTNVVLSEQQTGVASTLLTDEQFRVLLRALEKTGGVDVLSAPRVTTLSDRQAVVSLLDVLSIVVGKAGLSAIPAGAELSEDGKSIVRKSTLGPAFDLTPRVSADGKNINLEWEFTLTEFLGYDDPGPFVPQGPAPAGTKTGKPETAAILPRARERFVKHSTTIPAGQTLLIGCGVVESEAPKSRGGGTEKRHMLILLTPVIVDETGKPASAIPADK
jgi:hypothetical protein